MSGLSAAEKKAVQDSWAKLSAKTFPIAGEDVFMALLKNEGTKANFKKFKDQPLSKLKGSAVIRDHGEKVMQVFDEFVKGMDGGGDEAVKRIGRMHKGLGLTGGQIGEMKGALVEVLNNEGCGDAVGAWGKLFARFMEVHNSVY